MEGQSRGSFKILFYYGSHVSYIFLQETLLYEVESLRPTVDYDVTSTTFIHTAGRGRPSTHESILAGEASANEEKSNMIWKHV